MQQIESHIIEKKWQEYWSDHSLYMWDKSKSRDENFSIDTPPPTVSGELHMGHIFSYAQTDFIARFHRMFGKNVFYPIGFDNNGLPTERLVERVKKIRAKDFTREEFAKICNGVIKSFEADFRQLFKKLGISFDWSQEYRTISNESQKLSQMSFIDLLGKKLIQRERAPCFWDIKDQTAISQAEIVDQEISGNLYDIIFETTDGQNITIATSRPEMLSACVAIFYHPEDKRYNNLKNSHALIPLLERHVNIIADCDVDINKGTGLVMCCTFGDMQDITWWKKYRLDAIQCVNKYGKMCNAGFVDGLKVLEARELMIVKLKARSLIVGQSKVQKNVKCSERSGALLEIIIVDQWFIKVLPYKQKLLELNNQCSWNPKFMSERLKDWIKGLNQNWCISRQRYFGVPFPIWYSTRQGEIGKQILPAIEDLPVNPLIDLPRGYSREEVIAEQDVMDTWATSSLTPQLNTLFLSQDLCIDKHKQSKIFPFDLRPQAHEIIRTWAFSTLTKSFFHTGAVPWYNLMISGWCKTKNNLKMSKSKGNTIKPQKLLDQYGADVLRYWASDSKLGADVIFNEQTFKIGKKLINKLWNASKFYLAQIENGSRVSMQDLSRDISENIIKMGVDKWILSSLQQTVLQSTRLLQDYSYYESRRCIEDFFWNDFCDNYLELVKKRIYDTTQEAERNSSLRTLGYVLKTLLRLFAPYFPHVADEINEILFTGDQSVNSRGEWPNIRHYYFSRQDISSGETIKQILEQVRKYKSQHNLSLNSPIRNVSYQGKTLEENILRDMKNACNCSKIILDQSLISNAHGAVKVLIE